VPYIYLRNIFNIIKLSGLKNVGLLIGWIIGGMFYLLFAAAKDMFFLVKILCDYKLDDDKDEMM